MSISYCYCSLMTLYVVVVVVVAAAVAVDTLMDVNACDTTIVGGDTCVDGRVNALTD